MTAARRAHLGKLLQWLTLAEPLSVFGLIMLYIWKLRYEWHPAWVVILGLIVLSHVLHRDEAAALGLRPAGFTACVREYLPAVLFVVLALVAAGVLLGTMRDINFEEALLAFAGYYPWGLFQQYLLNSYFANRFQGVVGSRLAALLAATLFSAAHFPNWFLMPVTFVGGYCCVRIYTKYRNLYFLGLAHATIGSLLFLVVPDKVSRHLNVGPGWFR